MAGHSMEPALFDGDWLLVDPVYRSPVVGDIVVAYDPREAGRLLVKRVKSVAADGSLVIGGDHPGHTDEAVLVGPDRTIGRPWFRYWSLRRIGRVR